MFADTLEGIYYDIHNDNFKFSFRQSPIEYFLKISRSWGFIAKHNSTPMRCVVLEEHGGMLEHGVLRTSVFHSNLVLSLFVREQDFINYCNILE